MSSLDKNILDFLVALVAEFAARFGISQQTAYNYIRRYEGLDYYFRHLQNTATGYYYRSIGYLYDDLQHELTTRNTIICTCRGKAVPLRAEVKQRLRDKSAAPNIGETYK